MRLIDAETFLEALENADADVCETYPDFYCDWGFSRKAIEDLLLNIPTIEAKPAVHGEWVEVDVADYKCSVCGFRFTSADPIEMFQYCRCGADMRERKENGI